MDGSQFDTLLRRLTTSRSRRGAMVGLLAGAVSLLGMAETEAKHKKKKKKKTQPSTVQVTLCLNGQTLTVPESAVASLLSQGATEGACPPPSPPPPCVPESLATTCGGNCGTRTNNCGQSVTCSCAGMETGESNGSCALGCLRSDDCPGATCQCGALGPAASLKYCLEPLGACETMPDTCSTDDDCPTGSLCYDSVICNPSKRCRSLCQG